MEAYEYERFDKQLKNLKVNPECHKDQMHYFKMGVICSRSLVPESLIVSVRTREQGSTKNLCCSKLKQAPPGGKMGGVWQCF